MAQVFGNTKGLKASQIKGLERIYRRRIDTGELISGELARYMTELSREIKRQLGVVISRSGEIVATIVGDEGEIVIPVLTDYPLGKRHLRGVRLVHTHLKNEPLTEDDLTDLALLRLDYIAAIGVGEDGLPADIYCAHLLPYDPEKAHYEILKKKPFHAFDLEMNAFTSALDAEMGRAAGTTVKGATERAILVSVGTSSKRMQEELLVELGELARTAGIEVIDTLAQRVAKLNPRFLMGTGKARELIITALRKSATMLVFNQELSPTQIRELGDLTELKVIDRTQLILDIFAARAHSRDGKVQVELAQLKYLLPRLTGKGTSMSRLMGGIGGKGPGETKLEVDRRRAGDRISKLERELKSLSQGRKARRRKRTRSGIPIISIVGYTNAGKSTLLNALTESKTLTEDKLFATLDTATRRLRFPRERDAVITDTVGFIEQLPKDLMKAFKSTLEEMEDADILMHVVDVSSSVMEAHIETVERVLKDIGLDEIPRLVVMNKADMIDKEMASNLAARYKGVAVSALDKKTLPPLLKALQDALWPTGKGVKLTS